MLSYQWTGGGHAFDEKIPVLHSKYKHYFIKSLSGVECLCTPTLGLHVKCVCYSKSGLKFENTNPSFLQSFPTHLIIHRLYSFPTEPHPVTKHINYFFSFQQLFESKDE